MVAADLNMLITSTGDLFCACGTGALRPGKCSRLLMPPPDLKMALVPFFSYQTVLTVATSFRACLSSSFTILDSSRSSARWPPVQALRLTRALPSCDLGPVDLAHGFHCLINSACRALRSNVQPLTMICLQ